MVWDELLALQLGARRGRAAVSRVRTPLPEDPETACQKSARGAQLLAGTYQWDPLASRARSMSVCDVTEGCPCYYP
eukprot:scaffold12931_cov66-Phaeocystis_antarctica.AAC.1